MKRSKQNQRQGPFNENMRFTLVASRPLVEIQAIRAPEFQVCCIRKIGLPGASDGHFVYMNLPTEGSFVINNKELSRIVHLVTRL